MRRVLCAWLVRWPIQRLVRQRPELRGRPVVLLADAGNKGRSVVHCSFAAWQAGVRPGMTQAEAEAVLGCHALRYSEGRGYSKGHVQRGATPFGVPQGVPPVFEIYDPQADRAALKSAAILAQRFTPAVGLEDADAPEALLLEVGGSSHLFGGEGELAAALVEEFLRQGYVVRTAVADTVGAAWARSRHGHRRQDVGGPCAVSSCNSHGRRRSPSTPHPNSPPQGARELTAAHSCCVVPPGEQAEALRPLPAAALRLPDSIVQALHEFDLRTVGQVFDLPRSSLPARFGPELLLRVDQALGARPETIQAERLAEPLAAAWDFERPVDSQAAISAVWEKLLLELLSQLAPRGLGIAELRCSLKREQGDAEKMELGLLRPCAAQKHLLDLLGLQAERLSREGAGAATTTEGILGVKLEVLRAGVVDEWQPTWFDAADRQSERLVRQLVERLVGRCGARAVLRPRLIADPQPEFACQYEPRVSSIGNLQFSICNFQFPLRPLRLLPRPLLVEATSVVPDGPPLALWRGDRQTRIVRAAGPERIETGWWRREDVERDYYRATTATGRVLWLFRCRRTGRWFLHGVFE